LYQIKDNKAGPPPLGEWARPPAKETPIDTHPRPTAAKHPTTPEALPQGVQDLGASVARLLARLLVDSLPVEQRSLRRDVCLGLQLARGLLRALPVEDALIVLATAEAADRRRADSRRSLDLVGDLRDEVLAAFGALPANRRMQSCP
jgi:hypothetical protein